MFDSATPTSPRLTSRHPASRESAGRADHSEPPRDTSARQPSDTSVAPRPSSATGDSRPARPARPATPRDERAPAATGSPSKEEGAVEGREVNHAPQASTNREATAEPQVQAKGDGGPADQEGSTEGSAAIDPLQPGLLVTLSIYVSDAIDAAMPSAPASLAFQALNEVPSTDTPGATLVETAPLFGEPGEGASAGLRATGGMVQTENIGPAWLHQSLSVPQLFLSLLHGENPSLLGQAIGEAGTAMTGDATALASDSKEGDQLAKAGAAVEQTTPPHAWLQTLKPVNDLTSSMNGFVGDANAEQSTNIEVTHSTLSRDASFGMATDQHGAQASDLPGQELRKPQSATQFGDTVAAHQAAGAPRTQGGESHTATSSPWAVRPAGTDPWSAEQGRLPVIHSVSLDLEPADLGPVNVRIYMLDRTVHAHIRTEHVDLGQGMLGQQQQLETKLQHSGLEMGQFKVTVDQHQLPRGDSQGWLGQQANTPRAEPVQPRDIEPEPRDIAIAPMRGRSGIVSFFA